MGLGRLSISAYQVVCCPLSKVWPDCSVFLFSAESTPYRPDKNTAENARYNYTVSKVRIRSEHCVGFIKGRWQSLKGLRVRIDNPKQLTFATLWVTACINLHSFAMNHETGADMEKDSFFKQGVKYAKERRVKERRWRHILRRVRRKVQGRRGVDEEIELLEGKIKRQMLKEELLQYVQ